MSTLLTIFMALALLFGGAGATAYAAQDSLPSDPLYPVKSAAENLQLQLASGEQAKFNIALEHAKMRGDEIIAMQAKGEPVSGPVMTKLQDQFQYALQLASGMSDEKMQEALLQLREMVRTQTMKMTMTMTNAPEHVDPALEQVRQMFQNQLRLTEDALEDPLQFRQKTQSEFQNGEPAGPPEVVPNADQDPGIGPRNEEITPGGPSEQAPGQPVEDHPGQGPQGSPSGSGNPNQGSLVQPSGPYPTPTPTPFPAQHQGGQGKGNGGKP